MKIGDWYWFGPTQWMWQYRGDFGKTFEFWQGLPNYPDGIIIEVIKKSFNPSLLIRYTNQPILNFKYIDGISDN